MPNILCRHSAPINKIIAMRQLLLLIACLFVQSLTAQNFQSGFRQITFTDPARSNRAIPTDIYYPATSSGTNSSLPPGTQTFPVVVFGHGFVIPTSSYKWLGDTLSKYGFIAVFPTTESSFSPNHGTFGADITFLASRVTSLNDSSGSFFFGRVKKRAAVAGHSMGGGCSFLAAASANPVVYSIFNFAAAETNPSAQTAAAQVNLPALIFSGSSDCIVQPSTQKGMYTAIPYPCKTYINITGALHCHFAANDGTCAAGQLFSGCNSSSITASIVFQRITSLLIPFLNLYLNEECTSSDLFNERYALLTGAVKERVCTTDPKGCVVTGFESTLENKNYSVYPNPVGITAQIIIEWNEYERFSSYLIYSFDGSVVQSGELNSAGRKTIYLKRQIPGIYFIRLFSKTGSGPAKRFVVQ
jgi:predicted dienelactone hydrolase